MFSFLKNENHFLRRKWLFLSFQSQNWFFFLNRKQETKGIQFIKAEEKKIRLKRFFFWMLCFHILCNKQKPYPKLMTTFHSPSFYFLRKLTNSQSHHNTLNDFRQERYFSSSMNTHNRRNCFPHQIMGSILQ